MLRKVRDDLKRLGSNGPRRAQDNQAFFHARKL
jgi:hypothetical protein